MKIGTWALVLAASLSAATVLSAQPNPLDEQLVVLTSTDAPGVLTKQRVVSCLKDLAHAWNIPEQSLPTIIVLHVSQKAAAAAQIKDKVAVRSNSFVGRSPDYFEVWIVGEPNASSLVLALDNVLEAHFHLQVTEEQRRTLLSRVIRLQDATIDAQQGK